MRFAWTRAAGVALAAVAVLAGCSSGQRAGAPSTTRAAADATTTPAVAPTTSTTTSESPAVRAEIRLDHYAIEPADITVAAGTLTLAVANVDPVVHDVVLLRTDRAIDALPTNGVRVDETDPPSRGSPAPPASTPVHAATSARRWVPGGMCWCARCPITTFARRRSPPSSSPADARPRNRAVGRRRDVGSRVQAAWR